MSQAGRYRGELARPVVVLLVIERPDMQFVDDEFVPRREREVIPPPVKTRIVNNGIADRTGYLAGLGVDAA